MRRFRFGDTDVLFQRRGAFGHHSLALVEAAEDFHLGYTQWSVIADMSHKVYYYWTMYDRWMRSVDLSKLDFAGKAISSFPLDKVRTEDILDRSADFPH